jgi:hypothetical protein
MERIVTHGSDRFLRLHRHRVDDGFDLFSPQAEHFLEGRQLA